MSDRDKQEKLTRDIVNLIEAYEKETGMLVSSRMELNRGGCTSSPPYPIYGLHLTANVNSHWKPQ